MNIFVISYGQAGERIREFSTYLRFLPQVHIAFYISFLYLLYMKAHVQFEPHRLLCWGDGIHDVA